MLVSVHRLINFAEIHVAKFVLSACITEVSLVAEPVGVFELSIEIEFVTKSPTGRDLHRFPASRMAAASV